MIVQHHNEGRLSYLLRVAVAHITQHAPRAETVYDGQGQTGKTLANELDSLRALLPEIHPPATRESHAKRAPGHPFPEPPGGHLVTRLKGLVTVPEVTEATRLKNEALAAIRAYVLHAESTGGHAFTAVEDLQAEAAVFACGIPTAPVVVTGKLEATHVNEPALRALVGELAPMVCPKCATPLNLERGGPAANYAPQVQCFLCDIMATGHTHEEAYENLQRQFPRSQEYRILTEGETTGPELGDEFQHKPGVWVRTKRTGRLVHAGIVGSYRRPVLPPKPDHWPLPWHNDHEQTGCFGNIVAANGEMVAQVQILAPAFEPDIVKRNEWRNFVAREICAIINEASAIAGELNQPPP